MKVNIIFIACVWLFPGIMLMIPLFDWWGSLGFDVGSATCTVIDGESEGYARR